MKRFYLLCLAFVSIFPPKSFAADPPGLSVWFDTPTTLKGRAVWYNGRPDLWQNADKKPIAAGGDQARNPDQDWETQSLPLGNGSIGASLFGSVEAERLTFNEKTLWRGGPNTAKGPGYYWNVNKESAHVLADIRQADRKSVV